MVNTASFCADRKVQDRHCTYNATFRRVSATVVDAVKAMIFTCSDFVFVALGIQHAMRMRHIVTCGLPRSTAFFPRFLINGTIFVKKLLNTKCVF